MRSALNAATLGNVRIQCASSSSSSSFKDESASSSSTKNHHHPFAPKTKGGKKSVIVQPNVASISSSSSSLNNTNTVSAAMVVVGVTGTAVAIASFRSNNNKSFSGRRRTTSKAQTKDANTCESVLLKHVVESESALKTHNEETKEKYFPNFPEVVREDAHVYKDEDGYYVVKEEWQKPTNPFEKLKLAKDAMKTVIALNEIKTLGEKSGSTKEDFEKFEKELGDGDEIDHRLKWAGLFHRRKGHYGRFMMRLKLPGGIVSSEQMKYLASLVQSYGDDGCADITTRQNIQMRGIQLKDAHDIMVNLERLKMCSLQSGLDNARNATGSPIAGIDPLEIIDTRPFTDKIQEYVTGGGRGNPEIANLGRKWNVCVVGSSDYFEHPELNDLAFVPAKNETTGEMGFNVLVGGFISSARAAEAIPLDAWVPESDVVAMTHAILTTFRDYGHRGNRQKARMMWLVDEMGLEVFRTEVESRMPGGANSLARAAKQDLIDRTQVRRNVIGVHDQKQEGLQWVGANVVGGRLQGDDMMRIAELAEKYGSGEIRLTVEQNFLIPNVPKEKVDELLKDDLFSRYSTKPGRIVGNIVACTGNQFCGFAQIETKQNAYKLAEHLESVLDFPKDVRMIWTGCPNSCAPVQVADVGLMGAQVKDPSGAKGMVPGVNIFIGGTVGPTGHLKEKAEIEKVAMSELYPVVENVMIEKFGATRKSTPTENPNNAARWKINKSAQYTKGVPKALGKQTHICTGCGYIYSEEKPFDSLPADYVCPSCSAPKSKFEKMKTEDAAPKSARPVTEYPEGTLVTLKSGEKVKLKLVEKQDVSANTRRFRFELPTKEHILGLPVGQHVMVSCDGGKTSRPYTPITNDQEKGFMDLMVKIYDHGVVTQQLDKLLVGEDSVEFEGPNGLIRYTARGEFSVTNAVSNAVAKKANVKSISMICGGTGITPMLQVARQIFNDVGDTTKVNMIFANQSPKDILCKAELDELAAKDPNFSVHYTVDTPSLELYSNENKWTGSVGFVNSEMMKAHLPQPSDENVVLLCGPPMMVESCEKNLKSIGFDCEKNVLKF
ncbi:unnamed protein product [Bathycoccus prasinos]